MNRSQTQSSHLPVSSDTIRRMVEHLILNSSFTSDLGLFHGKMGIVIFFAHYARWTGNALYEDFADELLAEIYEDIHTDTPINLESGLCGIAWGIEYLVQNGFMEGDTDEILEDIDRRIMERDPRRMTDLSFRTGLGGILFYATARLTASRESDGQPFDSLYLNDLKEAAQRATFTEQDEIPLCLFENFLSALHGEPLPAPSLPVLLFTNLPQSDTYITLPVGLEKGIAGILANIFVTHEALQSTHSLLPNNSKEAPLDTRKSLYIINQESRAATYGIGTYIRQLIAAMRDTEWKITVVHFNSLSYPELEAYEEDSVHYIHVPMYKQKASQNSRSSKTRAYKNVVYLLRDYIKEPTPVFHFHYTKLSELIRIFRHHYPRCKTILTVHYVDWSFLLFGDRSKLVEHIENESISEEIDVKKSIEEDKQTMDLCKDGIIAISQYSYNMLKHDYGLNEKQVTLILNSFPDRFIQRTQGERRELRIKWGIQSEEIVLLIAGRVDEMKGVLYLVEAYKKLRLEFPNLRLIVSGDGEVISVMQTTHPYSSGVTFTGFIPQDQLFELYSIVDIGVLPSLHEEFGYVALEMMMMRLPLVVGKTTGLAELVLDGETGITIPVNDKEKITDELTVAISSLVKNESIRVKYAENGRKRYLTQYSFDLFSTRLKTFYHELERFSHK